MSTVEISKDRFEKFLSTVPLQFTQEQRGYEYIYTSEIDDDINLVIYSSIDVRSDKSRYEGSDAMRVNISDEDGNTLVTESHTKRTEGWEDRLREKIKELYHNYPDNVRECPECGRNMAVRSGQDGLFLGCTGWDPDNPECNNTEQIDFQQ